tara:strand:+ start:1426 stop:1776 length:351 start_codon:yes stop_codon:yes gene_type:complete
MANVLRTSRYKNAKLDLTTTDVTTLYTCPSLMDTFVTSILVSEDSGNADTITLTLTNGSDVFSIYKDKAIGAKGTLELLTNELILTSADILKVTAGTANRIHVVASFIEVPKVTTA